MLGRQQQPAQHTKAAGQCRAHLTQLHLAVSGMQAGYAAPSSPTWVEVVALAAGKHAHPAAGGHRITRLVGRAVPTRLIAAGH